MEIYFLDEYRWEVGELVSENAKSFTIQAGAAFGNRKIRKEKDKCAMPEESVVMVWEQWRGTNGRGGYRIERTLYPQKRRPAKEWYEMPSVNTQLWEKELGVIDSRGFL